MTTPETVESVIEAVSLITRFSTPAARADSRLCADLALDSLDRQSLAAELDESFAIEIPDDAVAEWETVTDVATTVDRLRGGA